MADVYSALTDQRSYKPALSSDEAMHLMEAWGEGRIDPESLRALESLAGTRTETTVSGRAPIAGHTLE